MSIGLNRCWPVFGVLFIIDHLVNFDQMSLMERRLGSHARRDRLAEVERHASIAGPLLSKEDNGRAVLGSQVAIIIDVFEGNLRRRLRHTNSCTSCFALLICLFIGLIPVTLFIIVIFLIV